VTKLERDPIDDRQEINGRSAGANISFASHLDQNVATLMSACAGARRWRREKLRCREAMDGRSEDRKIISGINMGAEQKQDSPKPTWSVGKTSCRTKTDQFRRSSGNGHFVHIYTRFWSKRFLTLRHDRSSNRPAG
jgi:ribosomal protein L39E